MARRRLECFHVFWKRENTPSVFLKRFPRRTEFNSAGNALGRIPQKLRDFCDKNAPNPLILSDFLSLEPIRAESALSGRRAFSTWMRFFESTAFRPSANLPLAPAAPDKLKRFLRSGIRSSLLIQRDFPRLSSVGGP
jgi:hypothetical protein